MKRPGTYTLSNGQVVRIVSAELVKSEITKITVQEEKNASNQSGGWITKEKK